MRLSEAFLKVLCLFVHYAQHNLLKVEVKRGWHYEWNWTVLRKSGLYKTLSLLSEENQSSFPDFKTLKLFETLNCITNVFPDTGHLITFLSAEAYKFPPKFSKLIMEPSDHEERVLMHREKLLKGFLAAVGFRHVYCHWNFTDIIHLPRCHVFNKMFIIKSVF